MLKNADFNSSMDNTNYNAIACEHIPELFLDKIVAKKHFSKFGKIKRFILRPKRLSCTIEYESNEDAQKALINAANFNGIEFDVRYAENEVAHVQNTEEWVDPEVLAELEAMGTGNRLGSTFRSTGLLKSNLLGKLPKHSTNLAITPKIKKGALIDKHELSQSELSKIDATVRSELEATLKTPAFSNEEKYRVLDARDKLIRLTTVRQTDIKKAVSIIGTCPDMCPEKERLMREFQRQVSTFEMAEEEGGESTISHNKAIKEYSRSSADQEVPLSHELRPEPVLKMTMLYLLHDIVGLCDDPKTSLADWFHFVWDRTRSIRKDITQQELCSLEAVQLVEQCARFHIHCAARLVAEDPSVFDKKINAENLTKCLQTLKYMYHDLRIKGVNCPCEAEFRSYVILLNLGDSNFLWEVKQLPEFIQKSFEIKNAIAFYNALQNNNFVRFFSMIKSSATSYLSACILLGYFTKLRVRAMDAIIKSHNWRKNDVYLPLSYLTKVLGFDEEVSAIGFLSHYGLSCDIKENRVLLDRLIQPDIEYAMERALQLVETKRHVSVGECIFGQTLPSISFFEDHQPHNSFDNTGMLKTEKCTADFISKKKIVQTKARNQVQEFSNSNVTSQNEGNFYITQQQFAISHKNQKQQEEKENTQESKWLSQAGFKFGDVFGDKMPMQLTTDSMLKTPEVYNSMSEQLPTTSAQTILKPLKEKPLVTFETFFSGFSTHNQSESSNVFSAAARETANIFQRKNDILKPFLKQDKNLQEPQNSFEKEILKTTLIYNSESNEGQDITLREENDEIKPCSENKKKGILVQTQEEDNLRNDELKILSDNQKEKNDQEIIKFNLFLQEKAQHTASLFISHIIEEEVSDIVQSELFNSQTISKASDLQKELIISEVVEVCVEDIANEEVALMCNDQLLLNRYFSTWLNHLRRKKKQRKLIENTPLWVTTDTRAEYAKGLEHPSQQKNMQMMKRYRFGESCEIYKILDLEQNIMFGENENPLNLFALIGQHLLTKRDFTSSGLLQQRKYFKLLITLPEDNEELLGFETFFNKWLMKSIENCRIETGPFVKGIEFNLALCVRKLNGIIPKIEEGNKMTSEGDHNDGIVCLITGIEIVKHSRKRLYNLLKLTKNLKRIPLAIIAYNCSCNKEELAKVLGLDVLQEKGLIYSYLILGCQINRKDFSFRKTLKGAIDFITKESYLLNSNDIQALSMQNILPFLETSLGEEMWQRWCNSANRNPIFQKICCIPEHVVGLFHKALDHLIHITQEDFDEMPEFPEELKQFVPENKCSSMPIGLEFFPANWKDKTDRNIIKSFLENLYLADIKEKIPENIEDLKIWLLNFACNCIKDDDEIVSKASHEALTNLIHQVNLQHSHSIELSSRIRMVNYLSVFKPIIFACITKTLKDFYEQLLTLKVVYLKNDLINYQTQPWWLNYEPLNQITIDYSEIPSSLAPTLQEDNKETSVSIDSIDKIISKAEETSRNVEESISVFKRKKLSFHTYVSTSKLKRKLDDSLYQFELSKKIGQYDTSFATKLTHDIDNAINEVLNHSPIATQARKISNVKSPDQCMDIENVIAKATQLINKVESVKEKSSKIKKICLNESI